MCVYMYNLCLNCGYGVFIRGVRVGEKTSMTAYGDQRVKGNIPNTSNLNHC